VEVDTTRKKWDVRLQKNDKMGELASTLKDGQLTGAVVDVMISENRRVLAVA
jgi:hypothetical protein